MLVKLLGNFKLVRLLLANANASIVNKLLLNGTLLNPWS